MYVLGYIMTAVILPFINNGIKGAKIFKEASRTKIWWICTLLGLYITELSPNFLVARTSYLGHLKPNCTTYSRKLFCLTFILTSIKLFWNMSSFLRLLYNIRFCLWKVNHFSEKSWFLDTLLNILKSKLLFEGK